jgi:hypothetical protein
VPALAPEPAAEEDGVDVEEEKETGEELVGGKKKLVAAVEVTNGDSALFGIGVPEGDSAFGGVCCAVGLLAGTEEKPNMEREDSTD